MAVAGRAGVGITWAWLIPKPCVTPGGVLVCSGVGTKDCANVQVLDRLGLDKKGRKADLQARILAYFGEAALANAGASAVAVANGAVQPPREQYKIDAAGAAIFHANSAFVTLRAWLRTLLCAVRELVMLLLLRDGAVCMGHVVRSAAMSCVECC